MYRIYEDLHFNRRIIHWVKVAVEMAQQLKPRGPGFSFQDPHGSSLSSIYSST